MVHAWFSTSSSHITTFVYMKNRNIWIQKRNSRFYKGLYIFLWFLYSIQSFFVELFMFYFFLLKHETLGHPYLVDKGLVTKMSRRFIDERIRLMFTSTDLKGFHSDFDNPYLDVFYKYNASYQPLLRGKRCIGKATSRFIPGNAGSQLRAKFCFSYLIPRIIEIEI